MTAADALGAPAKLASDGTTSGQQHRGCRRAPAEPAAPAAETTEVEVQPTAASSDWTNDLMALGLAGGLGAVVFAGAVAMWFRRRRAAVRANRAAFARGDSTETG